MQATFNLTIRSVEKRGSSYGRNITKRLVYKGAFG